MIDIYFVNGQTSDYNYNWCWYVVYLVPYEFQFIWNVRSWFVIRGVTVHQWVRGSKKSTWWGFRTRSVLGLEKRILCIVSYWFWNVQSLKIKQMPHFHRLLLSFDKQKHLFQPTDSHCFLSMRYPYLCLRPTCSVPTKKASSNILPKLQVAQTRSSEAREPETKGRQIGKFHWISNSAQLMENPLYTQKWSA